MNKGFITALLIFLTPIIVITVSTVWYYSGYGPEEKVNYGRLLSDPIDVGTLDLELDYQNLNVDSMERKWMLVHFINDACLESCADLIYVARQVNVLLARQQTRVKRYIAAPIEIKPKLENFFTTYQDLNFIEVKDQSTTIQEFKKNGIDPFAQPNMFVIDPIGNIILHYSGEVDGKKLLADLKKLLGASKIG
ncbi:MAG: hypothetical protein CMD94_03175 [Gammaproteobacteria bacterium]|nr:hypothetical protein [Gammaproteobacteria bacterium]